MTSPSIGTIRVSCDSSHQILVTLIHINDCNPTLTSNGSSPLTVTGLDPGIMYYVIVNVFDGNQVVLSDQTVMRTITVMSDQSGKICVHKCSYVASYICIILYEIILYD